MKINNTEKAIVLNYLQFIKKLFEKNCNKKIEIFSNYINHFSPKEWNDNFSDIIIKENSSLEKLDLIFQKILSQNWFEVDHSQIYEILSFFDKYNTDYKNLIISTYSISWENDELFIFYLFKEFLDQILKRIDYYSNESNFYCTKNENVIKYNENIKNYEEKLKNTDSEKLRQETTKLIEKEKIKIILMFSFQE